MIQRVVRFYEDSNDDITAWDILRNHKKYGYDSYSKMIIAALLKLVKPDDSKVLDMDILVDKLVDRLKDNIGTVSITPNVNVIKNDEEEEEFDLVDDALNFINEEWGGSSNE